MGGELLPALGILHEEFPETRLVLGMRDILDAPEATCRTWQEQGVLDILERVYDQILVYGREDWFDVVAAYAIPPRIARKVRYCGYVCNDPALEASLPPLPSNPSGRPRVLVTVGGGGDGCCVIEAYLAALRRGGGFGCQSLIVPGPLMDPEQRRRLESSAASCSDVHMIDGVTDMLSLMEQCDLVISMAGYNTSVELLCSGRRAILVPRARPRAEQRLRAQMLARFGFADLIDPDGDIAAQLGGLVPDALRAGRSTAASPPALEGAQRVAAVLDALTCRADVLREA
jgi:predicted glycosyltransferase